MDLYIVLFAIAALGILALVLIFLGRTKSSPKQILFPLHKETDVNELTLPPEKVQNRTGYSSVNKNIHNANIPDPGLASLGFSAYDGLLMEPQTVSGPAISANPKLQQYHLASPRQKLAGKDDLVILYLMAPVNQPFVGYELQQALLAVDLRYGKMNIFHRHPEETNQDVVLFSVASAVEPGIFDMANIGALVCPGLSLFMSISTSKDPAAIFELILETAQQLSDDLGGTLCDGDRKPLTEDTLAEYRMRVLV